MATEGHEGTGSSGRRRVVLIAVLAVAIIGGAIATYRWAFDPDRQLGPAPTATGNQCGLGRGGSAVLALDGRTGALRWSRLVDNDDSVYAHGLAAADGTVAVFTSGGTIIGLSAGDGAHRWCSSGGVVSAVDDRVFTIQGKATVELDPGTGKSQRVADNVLPSLLEDSAGDIAVSKVPTAYEGRQQSITVTATDRDTGASRWKKRVPGYEFVTTDDLMIVNDQTNGTFEFGDNALEHASATAYLLTTGDQAWSTVMPTFGGVFLAGDAVVLEGSGDDGIMALDARTGRVLWDVQHDNPGRTVRNSEHGWIQGVARDEASDTIFVLIRSMPPHRD